MNKPTVFDLWFSVGWLRFYRTTAGPALGWHREAISRHRWVQK